MTIQIYDKEYDKGREDIIAAMKAFDDGDCPAYYKSWLTNPQFKFAVKQGRRYYPPKFLITHVTGLAGRDFSPEEAIRNLRHLNFTIADKP